MTDDLRARIAAVLAEAQETHNGISDLELADAVIRELGEYRRSDLVQFAKWLLEGEPGEGREDRFVDEYLGTPHSSSYIDAEGEQRCSTCDKWLERDYYTIDDHHRSEVAKESGK